MVLQATHAVCDRVGLMTWREGCPTSNRPNSLECPTHVCDGRIHVGAIALKFVK